MSYQLERDQFIAVFAARVDSPRIQQGPGGVLLARALLRAATSLQRYAAAQCNGDYPYGSGRHDRPGPAGFVPCAECGEATDKSAMRGGKAGACPECRTRTRVRGILAGSGWVPYFQGDPRGCVLYIQPDDGRGEQRYTGNHPDAIGVPGRY